MKGRMIDSHYNTLFEIEDGKEIVIEFSDGKPSVTRVVKWIDPTHFNIGGWVYHICEFAEKMERAGATYRPA